MEGDDEQAYQSVVFRTIPASSHPGIMCKCCVFDLTYMQTVIQTSFLHLATKSGHLYTKLLCKVMEMYNIVFIFQLDAPLFVTWFQCVVCLVCLFLLSFLGDKYPWIDKFPAFNIDLKVAREVSTCSNYCYYMAVSGSEQDNV